MLHGHLVLVSHEHADIYGILIGYDNINHQHTCVDGLLSVSVCFFYLALLGMMNSPILWKQCSTN